MSLLSRLEKLESTAQMTVDRHVEIDFDACALKVIDPNMRAEDLVTYIPSKTGLEFHKDQSFIRCVKGPYGSGKSTMCCIEIILKAAQMPPCKDGIVHARWAVVRNTYGELDGTTYQTWLSWFDCLGTRNTKRAPRFIVTHKFNFEGKIIELELILVALDRPDQLKKLKSLELTGVYLNEVCETPEGSFAHFKGRVNKRYPAKKDIDQDYWAGIIADTNPPDTDHWLFKIFEVDRPKNYKMFYQPPALLKEGKEYVENPLAENINNLGAGYGYYFEMTYGQTEEWIKVYVMGLYGTAIDGKHVYTNYNDDLHSVEHIAFDPKSPILMTIDPGIVCPAVLISQYIKGQLRAIKEFIGNYITVKELMTGAVKPFLYKHCKGMEMEIVRDPADTDSCEDQLREIGLESNRAATNQIEARIRAQRDFLNILVEGKPGYILSRTGCPRLRKGFLGHYKYCRLRVIGEEKYRDVPDKNHPYSDVHDCQQYAALEFHTDAFVDDGDDYRDDYSAAHVQNNRNPVTGY